MLCVVPITFPVAVNKQESYYSLWLLLLEKRYKFIQVAAFARGVPFFIIRSIVTDLMCDDDVPLLIIQCSPEQGAICTFFFTCNDIGIYAPQDFTDSIAPLVVIDAIIPVVPSFETPRASDGLIYAHVTDI
jgi:hypothetical protein